MKTPTLKRISIPGVCGWLDMGIAFYLAWGSTIVIFHSGFASAALTLLMIPFFVLSGFAVSSADGQIRPLPRLTLFLFVAIAFLGIIGALASFGTDSLLITLLFLGLISGHTLALHRFKKARVSGA